MSEIFKYYDPTFPPYQPRISQSHAAQCIQLSNAATTKLEKVIWAIPFWLPAKALTILAGPSNCGKSTVACSIVARVTRGGNHSSWPDERNGGDGNVLIISNEENFASTIVPRLLAADADLKRVVNIDGTKDGMDLRPFTFSEADIKALCEKIKYVFPEDGVGLIVIDLVTMAVSGDESNNTKVQNAYRRLTRLAENLDCAILGITHSVKNQKGKTAISRVSGPIAAGGVARSIWVVNALKPGDSDDGATHVLVLAKSFSEPMKFGYTYSIKCCEVDENIKTSRSVWHGTLQGSADEILSAVDSNKNTHKLKARERAKTFLCSVLQHGPVSVRELEKMVKIEGYSYETLCRAKEDLGVISKKIKGAGQSSGFEWFLPPSAKG